MTWEQRICENIYDLTPKKPKPQVRAGSIRSSLSGRAREAWDRAQQAKKKVSEEDKKTEKSSKRLAIEDLVRRIAQKSGAAKELGRLATPAISKR